MKSERGASMSMALMTFLVCTMVASVTLTAATAVAGRQKTLEDADKNYYSVTSAAKVFRDELRDGSLNVPVAVNRSCVVKPVMDGGGNETGYTYVDDSATIKIDDCGEANALDGAGTESFDLNEDSANMFQILAGDMVLGENLPAGTLSANMDYDCEVTCDKARNTIDTGSIPEPKLKPLNCSSVTYSPLNIAVDHAKIDDVSLTVYREENLPQPGYPPNPCVDFRFVFESKDETGLKNNFKVTLLVKATATDSDTRGVWNGANGTYTYSWDTFVTWECMSMIVGGA